MTKRFKVVVYIPADAFDDIFGEFQKTEVNRIGNYINCMSWTPVQSTWTPLEGAKPAKGIIDKRSIESEIRLELSCEECDVEEVVCKIKQIHPYEEPEIDLYPIVLL